MRVSGVCKDVNVCEWHASDGTYGGEFFHSNRFVIQDAFVHSAEPPLPQPAATVGHMPVIKIARYLDQLTVWDIGKT